jgi:Uma2 family endonuclease
MANLTMTTSPRIPLLCAGDVLTRDEFERRYQAMPWLKKAELIEGVVYMGSPVRFEQHSSPEGLLAYWLGTYVRLTPVLRFGTNASVRLDLDNMPQPDLVLRIPAPAGGRSTVGGDGYLEGPPELVVEVAASSASYDLHQKLRVYRRNGVHEYLVVRSEDGAVDWFVLRDGTYERQEPDAAGCLGSDRFPGLVLDPAALWRGDCAALAAAIERAAGSSAHAAFVVHLARAND